MPTWLGKGLYRLHFHVLDKFVTDVEITLMVCLDLRSFLHCFLSALGVSNGDGGVFVKTLDSAKSPV